MPLYVNADVTVGNVQSIRAADDPPATTRHKEVSRATAASALPKAARTGRASDYKRPGSWLLHGTNDEFDS